jgi:hypothetical protein
MLFERGWKHTLKRVLLLCLMSCWRLGDAAHLALHDEKKSSVEPIELLRTSVNGFATTPR